MTDNYIVAANERQAPLEAAKAAFFASGGQVKVGPGVPDHPIPPVRRDWIDPETVLVRKTKNISPAGRKKLRQMADSL
jgi:hypothetical protein